MFALKTFTITILILASDAGNKHAVAKCPFGFGAKNVSEMEKKPFDIGIDEGHPTVS